MPATNSDLGDFLRLTLHRRAACSLGTRCWSTAPPGHGLAVPLDDDGFTGLHVTQQLGQPRLGRLSHRDDVRVEVQDRHDRHSQISEQKAMG